MLGIGVVELSSGTLGQTSRFSLELPILLVLQLVGPMLVTLIAMALLLPMWLEGSPNHDGGRGSSLVASALVGNLLLLFFLAAAITGGVLASPRADLMSEFSDVLRGVLLTDLLRSCLRAAFFLAMLCGWRQLRGQRQLQNNVAPTLVSSDLMVKGLMLLVDNAAAPQTTRQEPAASAPSSTEADARPTSWNKRWHRAPLRHRGRCRY